MAAGAKLDRKVYRIRNMEILKSVGDRFEVLHEIHKVSKATIGLISDSKSDRYFHSFLDLMGTEEQVKVAEELILDKIIETYGGSSFPVILMPPTVYGHEIRLHVGKAVRLLGKDAKNALALEIASGAWVQLDQAPSGGLQHERIVNVFGPKAHVVKAVSLIYSQVFEPGDVEAEEDLEMLFKELSLNEIMEGVTYGTPRMVDFASGSGSGQTEEQKQLD